MTKEYHAFTDIQDTHEQAFIFEVERDGEHINLGELWMITTQGDKEIKTRVHLDKMFQQIGDTIGGNLDDEGVESIMDMFEDILPGDKRVEMQVDICQKKLDNMPISDADKLIKASELSKRIDDEIGNISVMAENIINKRL